MRLTHTWKNILSVGTIRMDPPVPLLYDTLEHDAEFRGFLSSVREEIPKNCRECRLSRNVSLCRTRNYATTDYT